MNKKLKYLLKGGLIVGILAVILEITFLNFCTTNLFCVGLNLILLSPGLYVSNVLKLGPNIIINIFGNVIFYFILGGIIGLIVYKIKSKKQEKKK